MLENIRLSFQGIWSHKMRSFLTMLGIIIGIASIISIVSTIKGTNEEIKNSLVGSGNNTVDVLLYSQGYPFTVYSESDIPFGVSEVSDETREKIREVEGVANVTCYSERQNMEGIFIRTNRLQADASAESMRIILTHWGIRSRKDGTSSRRITGSSGRFL